MNKIIIILVLTFFNLQSSFSKNVFITLASTTSTENSGLLSYILPFFENQTGISVRVLTRGTGQALELGRRGDVDVVFVHAKSLEDEFVSKGFGVERFPVMYNDFILVGPKNNPARIVENDGILSAFKKIKESKSIFVSRGDNSGTDIKEKSIWMKLEFLLASKNVIWYKEVGSGMGATLNISSALNGYTLSDRATWETFRNKKNLEILLQGDPLLFNQYGVILVNPKLHSHVKKNAGQNFINWLISPKGQKLIESFKSNEQQLFFSNYRN